MGCVFFFDRWELFLCCDVAENLLQGKTMRVSSNKYIMYEKSYDVISPYETVGEVKLEPLSLFLFAVIVLLPRPPCPPVCLLGPAVQCSRCQVVLNRTIILPFSTLLHFSAHKLNIPPINTFAGVKAHLMFCLHTSADLNVSLPLDSQTASYPHQHPLQCQNLRDIQPPRLCPLFFFFLPTSLTRSVYGQFPNANT